MVIVITVSFVYASIGPYIAYTDQPFPFLTGVVTIVFAIGLTLLFPKNAKGTTLTSIEKDEKLKENR